MDLYERLAVDAAADDNSPSTAWRTLETKARETPDNDRQISLLSPAAP